MRSVRGARGRRWCRTSCSFDWQSKRIASAKDHERAACSGLSTNPSYCVHLSIMKLLANLRPELRLEWDASKNGKMKFEAMAAHSKIRVWWRCTKDKRHEWQAQVRDRTLGHGCPFCSGRYTLREESFGALFPALVKQLHPSKNPDFDPFATAPLSNKKVFWVCSKQPDHVWESRLSGRTESDAGCPICRQTASSLANAAPDLAKEWHPKKNLPHTTETVSTGSRLKAWWQCKTNPLHVWDAQVRMRVDARTGCPICARSQPQATRPTVAAFSAELAKQWHPTKNENLTPEDITVGSHRSVRLHLITNGVPLCVIVRGLGMDVPCALPEPAGHLADRASRTSTQSWQLNGTLRKTEH